MKCERCGYPRLVDEGDCPGCPEGMRTKLEDRARKDNLWLLHEAGYEFLHTTVGQISLYAPGADSAMGWYDDLAAAVDAATEHRRGGGQES